MDLRQSPQYATFMHKSGWIVEELPPGSIKVYIRRLPALPVSVIKVQRFDRLPDFSALHKLRVKNRAIYTILEPEFDCPHLPLATQGFHLSTSPFLPTATLRLDLTSNHDKLWRELSTNVQRILTKQTVVQIDQACPQEFLKSWQKEAKLWPLSERSLHALQTSFQDNCELLVSRFHQQIVSGLILLKTDDRAFYYQTWTSPLGRSLNAHFYLVWEVIQRLKKEGLHYFDFDGVWDPRFPIKSWRGFSQFKQKFGGELVQYPGCFTRWL